jgi:uncharacterized protein
MKFQSDATTPTAIRSYGTGWILLAGQSPNERLSHNVILSPEGVEPWAVPGYADLTADHFAILAQRKPELVIFGSGTIHRFPKPAWLRSLVDARIGIETMNTPAACRTWNILLSEGRHVLAALLVAHD